MFFECRTFWLPKDVEHPDAYQDAFAVDEARGLAAIADGVSSSLFAASWAKLLVDAAVNDTPEVASPQALGPWLAELRRRWREPIDVDKLAWHQKPKFADGAFTTLLWIQIEPGTAGKFPLRAYSLGDCCYFHVRDDQVLRAFPFESSTLFDTKPKMVGSVARPTEAPLEFDTLQDVCHEGDLLVLCTDALAVWALQQLEAGSSPRWEACWNLTQDEWTDSVLEFRAENKIRYDDTTAILLRVGGGADSAAGGAKPAAANVVDDVKRGISNLFKSR